MNITIKMLEYQFSKLKKVIGSNADNWHLDNYNGYKIVDVDKKTGGESNVFQESRYTKKELYHIILASLRAIQLDRLSEDSLPKEATPHAYWPDKRVRKPLSLDDIKSIRVDGRRWFDKGPGNTYCSSVCYINEEKVFELEPTYGYDDYYFQESMSQMIKLGLLPSEFNDLGYFSIAQDNNINLEYSAVDVKKERDL